MQKTQTFTCTTPQRLDTYMSSVLNETRNQVISLIKEGCVEVDGKKMAKAGLKLKENQKIIINFPEAKETPALEIDFDVPILYEDDDILVINKPSGLTVHPAPSVKEPTLVDWLKHKGIRLSTISGEERHGIVHRLDKGTSGVMVVAKNNEAHVKLSEQLQDKSMGRYYLALNYLPLKNDIIVEGAINRSPNNRLKMSVRPEGKEAQTAFKKLLLSNDEKEELLACKLFTGRTHQIRVHLEHIGRGILGDHLYGFKSKEGKIERIFLHAYILYLVHPSSGERVEFIAPLDNVMLEYINANYSKDLFNEQISPSHFERHFTDLS